MLLVRTGEYGSAVDRYRYAIVPLGGKGDKRDGPKPKKEPKRVPQQAAEVGFWKLRQDAGLAFAMLTGDFNPVHWIRPYARMFGFRSTILHGFSTMARAYEGLVRTVFAGATGAMRSFDVQFTKPLILPARVGLYLDGDQVYVGDAPGGPAYLVGTITRADP